MLSVLFRDWLSTLYPAAAQRSAAGHLGFGRIAASESEAPNTFAKSGLTWVAQTRRCRRARRPPLLLALRVLRQLGHALDAEHGDAGLGDDVLPLALVEVVEQLERAAARGL
jgi:hypothetical protein